MYKMYFRFNAADKYEDTIWLYADGKGNAFEEGEGHDPVKVSKSVAIKTVMNWFEEGGYWFDEDAILDLIEDAFENGAAETQTESIDDEMPYNFEVETSDTLPFGEYDWWDDED